MKIALCGSMAFAQEMLEAERVLKKQGYRVILPEGVQEYIDNDKFLEKLKNTSKLEDAKRKKTLDLVKKHYHKIKNSDAILVINKDKNGIKGYIGGNTFLEMGFAHVLNKKIFTTNPLSNKQDAIYQELMAMEPTVIGEKLTGLR